MNAVMLF